jgi:hypothetical protein
MVYVIQQKLALFMLFYRTRRGMSDTAGLSMVSVILQSTGLGMIFVILQDHLTRHDSICYTTGLCIVCVILQDRHCIIYSILILQDSAYDFLYHMNRSGICYTTGLGVGCVVYVILQDLA